MAKLDSDTSSTGGMYRGKCMLVVVAMMMQMEAVRGVLDVCHTVELYDDEYYYYGDAKPYYGGPCVFPFIYEGVTYYECTDVEADEPWCATQTDSDGSMSTDSEGFWHFGYCDEITCRPTTGQ